MAQYEHCFDQIIRPSLEAIRVNDALAQLIADTPGLFRHWGESVRLSDDETKFSQDGWKGVQGHKVYGQ